ncbi:hypothetical protein [Singulisphaera acidiphila]|uniref:Uncharacterized protein n=1 Tax=Singulisphaera acidiphila (strain ATCC BAA-1392 / DSM 18658 / VKM B-2454 / MOB10) TaxID=886293 RepID=L0D840_SINAD|nr:hypothetical protein [Singulisphaera acidiphila]AGA25035.1 hypothetical protein Sinac_0616 [Singulisphaera acidiphila DSM 18658]
MATVDQVRDCAQTNSPNPARNTCRLILLINSHTYHTSPHRDRWPFATVKAYWLRKVSDGMEYLVAQTLTGLTCTCPAFQMCKRSRFPEGGGDRDWHSRHSAHRTALGSLPLATIRSFCVATPCPFT